MLYSNINVNEEPAYIVTYVSYLITSLVCLFKIVNLFLLNCSAYCY